MSSTSCSAFERLRSLKLIVVLGALLVSAAARAETWCPSIQFVREGARYQGYFDPDSTGTVTVVIPPAVAPAGPLVVTRSAISADEFETTTTQYDPGTTSAVTVSVGPCAPGAHLLTARLPASSLMRWGYFVRRPESALVPIMGGTTESLRLEYRDLVLRRLDPLFDRETSGTWLGMSPESDYHWIREDVYYALALLDRGTAEDLERANATLMALFAAQDRQTTSPRILYGQFYENGTDMRTHSSAVSFFSAPILARLVLDPPAGLAAATQAELRLALTAVCEYLVFRFDVGYSLDHTNFQALGIAGLALAGKALQRSDFVARARQQMTLFYNHLIPAGGSMEFNSPVYSGVTQWSFKLILNHSGDAQLQAQARVLYERFWLDAALYHHPQWSHFAGPYSRAYKDIVRGGTHLLGLLLSAELGQSSYASPGRVGENFDAWHSLDLNPAFFETTLGRGMSPEAGRLFQSVSLPSYSTQRTRAGDTSTYLSSSFTLGTSDWAWNWGAEGFLLQVSAPESPAGIAPVIARAGTASPAVVTYDHRGAKDILAHQSKGKAVVAVSRALGTEDAAGTRSFLALVADERFDTFQDLRINGTPSAATADFTLTDTIFLRRGETYLAVRPLYADAASTRTRVGALSRGEGHLNISLHCSDSSAALSTAGQRLEAALAVACTEAPEWDSYEEFISDFLTNSTVQITEGATTRTVNWNWRGSLECQVDRAAGRLTERRIAGQPLSSLLVQSEYAQQTAGSSVQLRDLTVEGLAPYSWVLYPPVGGTALVVNPATTTQTLTTNWSMMAVEIPPYGLLHLEQPPQTRVEHWNLY